MVPETLASCLSSVTWEPGKNGIVGVSRSFSGSEAWTMWQRGLRCTRDTGWTVLLVPDDTRTVTIGHLFLVCEPPNTNAATWDQVEAAHPIERDVVRDLTDLADPATPLGSYGEQYAELGRSMGDPYAIDMSDWAGGPPGQFDTFQLAVLPTTTEALLGCMSHPEDSYTARAILARWRSQWKVIPYGVHGGGFTLYVPSPPTVPSDIASVAMEHARFNPEGAVYGNEEFFKTAASQFWFFWWD